MIRTLFCPSCLSITQVKLSTRTCHFTDDHFLLAKAAFFIFNFHSDYRKLIRRRFKFIRVKKAHPKILRAILS